MTLEEAIKHATEVADQQDAAGFCKCAANHRLLAEWLTELKERREKGVPDTNVGDPISRQAAIDALRTCYDTEAITYTNGNEYISYDQALSEIEGLPSKQPERKKGEWVQDDIASNIFRCSECGCDAPVDSTAGCEIKSDFCQSCGADMRGEQTVRPEQRWTPCSERPPEENGEYLVTRASKGIYRYIDIVKRTSANAGRIAPDIVAWMPAPEPYRRARK